MQQLDTGIHLLEGRDPIELEIPISTGQLKRTGLCRSRLWRAQGAEAVLAELTARKAGRNTERIAAVWRDRIMSTVVVKQI